MKKNIFIAVMLVGFLGLLSAQNDLQVIAQVNLFKKEPITLGQLKKQVASLELETKQKTSIEDRKSVLTALMNRTILLQAAEKEGVKVMNSEVDDYFSQVISQNLGVQITEAEFAKKIKQEYNKSLDEFTKENTGMNVSEAKKMLREQLLIEKYVWSKKSAEIQKLATPQDSDIRKVYDLNVQQFLRPDMIKLVLISIKKDGNDAAETKKINELNAKLKKNVKALAEIEKNAKKEGYNVQSRYALKNELGAQALGLQHEALLQIFEKDVNFVSDITDMPDNRQFFLIAEKHPVKILGLSDVIDPSQTITVYEVIKNQLVAQGQQRAIQIVNQELINELRTDDNCKILKKDADLDALLSW
ncbi:MOSP complex formation periplasmic protein, TDE1658 family [Treponema denticola]|uniref:MOSP complex formation periplasmic protein, TDE1658 family n=1 Tax=Treponema denticola TaxID=158 RepID=UPI0021045A19|nr:SurA N-terminal domain-containing protein [Treponema denticola]UTY24041.1 hypothetical protein E4N78_07810 [Treponema denticola]